MEDASILPAAGNTYLSLCLSYHHCITTLDDFYALIASCSVGGAQFCTDMASQYVQTRHQFGKSISAFQNTEFKLADMATSVHASRLMVR